jgi:hypothetical protein
MYGNGPIAPAAAGVAANGVAFGVSTTLGLVVAGLTLLFALVALLKLVPKRRRQQA